jgi:hypothetical protein
MSIDPTSLGSPRKIYSKTASENWNLRMLRQAAKNAGIKGVSTKTKPELLEILKNKTYEPIVGTRFSQRLKNQTDLEKYILEKQKTQFDNNYFSQLSPDIGNDKDYFSQLPPDITRSIANKLKMKDAYSLSKTSTATLSHLHKNDIFWKQRFLRDFPTVTLEPTKENYMRVYALNPIIEKISDYLLIYNNNAKIFKLYEYMLTDKEKMRDFFLIYPEFYAAVLDKSEELLKNTGLNIELTILLLQFQNEYKNL